MLTLQPNTNRKILLGSIQLPSFLKSSSSMLRDIADYAKKNARLFLNGGFDGVFIQDTTPGTLTLETICDLTAVTQQVRESLPDFYVGVQMECDAAEGILAVAKASSCDMVRIKTYVGAMLKDSGIHNGQGAEALKYMIQNDVQSAIFADVFNLAGVPVGNISLEQACSMALKRGASALVLCGHGLEETLALLRCAKRKFPESPVICGGNATIDNVAQILRECDGVIASSSLRNGDKSGWDPTRIKAFATNAGNR